MRTAKPIPAIMTNGQNDILCFSYVNGLVKGRKHCAELEKHMGFSPKDSLV